MKVRVALSVEVDADEWAMEQGCDPRARAVSEDVKSYVLNAIQQAPTAGIGRVELAR